MVIFLELLVGEDALHRHHQLAVVAAQTAVVVGEDGAPRARAVAGQTGAAEGAQLVQSVPELPQVGVFFLPGKKRIAKFTVAAFSFREGKKKLWL